MPNAKSQTDQHVLGGGAAGPRLKEAASVDERHDGEHARGGAQLDDGVQVRQVVAQHVARHRDHVLALPHLREREFNPSEREFNPSGRVFNPSEREFNPSERELNP
eukprot:2398461-Pyramimonas_sp.AAC.2